MGDAAPTLSAAGSAYISTQVQLLLARQKQGIEHTQCLLHQALEELEAARQREQGLLEQRMARLQQQHADKMAELERAFLIKAEELQQQLASGITAEAAKSQQVLDALAGSLLVAVESAEVVPAALAGPAAAHILVPVRVASPGERSPYMSATGSTSSPTGKSPARPQISCTARAGLPPFPGRTAISTSPRPRSSPGQGLAEQQRPAPLSPSVLRMSGTAGAAGAAGGVSAPARGKPACGPALQGTQQAPSDCDCRHEGLHHESSSEYDSDSYWQEGEDSEHFDAISSRPPPVKTVMPAGLDTLLRKSTLPAASRLTRPDVSGNACLAASPRPSHKESATPSSPLLRQYSTCMCGPAGSRRFADVLSDDDD